MTRTERVQKILNAYSFQVHELLGKLTPLYSMPDKFQLPDHEQVVSGHSSKILAYLRLLLGEMKDPELDIKYRTFLEHFAGMQLALRQNHADEFKIHLKWLILNLSTILRETEARYKIRARSGKEKTVDRMKKIVRAA